MKTSFLDLKTEGVLLVQFTSVYQSLRCCGAGSAFLIVVRKHEQYKISQKLYPR